MMAISYPWIVINHTGWTPTLWLGTVIVVLHNNLFLGWGIWGLGRIIARWGLEFRSIYILVLDALRSLLPVMGWLVQEFFLSWSSFHQQFLLTQIHIPLLEHTARLYFSAFLAVGWWPDGQKWHISFSGALLLVAGYKQEFLWGDSSLGR
jgi:hypothetical protein